jgi:hypothetical protein
LPRNRNAFTNTAWNAAKTIHRHTESTLSILGRWATTDHIGMDRAVADFPYMGFVPTLKLILARVLIGIMAGALTLALITIVISALFSLLFLA